jgi:predicted glycoside hydrolase/deacetylase ChbG (UPF0249 family)
VTKTLEFLGYDPTDRVLIIHADDVGFSHASNVAAFEAMTHGSLTCSSALVPAPWFMETAKLQREQPDADIGVHMTLTAEYETYRWRAASGLPSLHAPDNGMWRDVESVVRHVPPEDARVELRAQIELALASGIDVTHLDTHMGAVVEPQYVAAYVDLAIEYKLPLFYIRPSARRLEALGAGAAAYQEQYERLDALGWPLLDHAIHRTLSQIEPEDKEARFRAFFADLRPGLTHFLCHPAKGGEELDAIVPETCRHRAKEYDLFRGPEFRTYCESLGIKLTGYREIRDRLRASISTRA